MFLCFTLAARHAGSGHRSTHTHSVKRESGSVIVGEICKLCYDFNAAYFNVALCQRGHQLWRLLLTFLSPLEFLTNLILESRQ